MTPACGSCGRSVPLSRIRVLVRSAGDYLILGTCCRTNYQHHKQYEPRRPRAAVDRINGGDRS